MKRKEEYEYSAFGKIILKRLIDMNKGRKWLSEAAGISLNQITVYVTGKNAPQPRVLYRIATALSLDCNVLLEAIASEENKRYD